MQNCTSLLNKNEEKFETPINLRSNTFKPFLKLCSSPNILEPKPIIQAATKIDRSTFHKFTTPNAYNDNFSEMHCTSKDYKVVAKGIRNYAKKGLEYNENIVDAMFKLHLQLVQYQHHELFPPNDSNYKDLDKHNSSAKFKVSANANTRCSSSYSNLKVNLSNLLTLFTLYIDQKSDKSS